MTHNEFITRTHYCEDSFPLFPAVDSRQNAGSRQDGTAARINAKLARVERLIAQRTAAPVPDPGPSAGQIAAQMQAASAARMERICAEAKAAYDARNPHKKDRGAV